MRTIWWLVGLGVVASSLVGAAELEAPPDPSAVIINEIHYHPPSGAAPLEEYVELHNRSGRAIDIHGWALRGGIRLRFDREAGPSTIPAGGFLLVARQPPAVATLAGLSAEAVAGPYDGKLSNFHDRVVLVDRSGEVADVVEYHEDGPWPAAADGLGSSLQRIASEGPGNAPQNWAAMPGTQERRPETSRSVLGAIVDRLRGRAAAREPDPSGAVTPGRANSVARPSMPPLVTALERVPEQPRPDDAVTVRALVEGSGVARVELRFDLGSGENTVAFAPIAQAPRGGPDALVYAARIPPAPDQTVVRFRIIARNREGATFELPRRGNPSPYLGYYVLDRPRDESADLDVYHLLWSGPLSCSKGQWLRGCTFVHRGTAYLDVGLKYRGLTSCGRPKSGLKVDFHRGALFRGRSQLNLLSCWQDRSFLREKLAWDLLRDTGHAHCEARMAAVYSWGNRLHGLFVALEEPGAGYLRRNHLDAGHTLWKCHTSFLRGYLGVERSRRQTYDKRTNIEDGNDPSDVLELELALNTLRGKELREYVLRHIDIESLIEYQAVKALISDEDGYSKNWFLCQETRRDEGGSTDHRWSVHAWDMDLSFGQYSLYTDEIGTDRHPLAGTVDHPRHGSHGLRWNGLLEAVFGRESEDYFIKALYGRIWDLLEEKFRPSVLVEKIDRLDLATIEEARADMARVPRWGMEGQNVALHRQRLREYVFARYEHLRRFLASEQPTTASEVGPWAPLPTPRVASGIVPARAIAYRTFRYAPAPRLRIVEIHYHPAGDEEREFIEIRNLESVAVDVSGWDIPAVGFRFPEGTRIAAGSTFVVARNPRALLAGDERRERTTVFGPYPGRLSNRGEDLRLRDSGRAKGRAYFPETIDVVKYRDRAPWPAAADGEGRSLELTDLAADNDLPGSWRASSREGGSPGE